MSHDELPNFEIKFNSNEVYTEKEPPHKKKRRPLCQLGRNSAELVTRGSSRTPTTHVVKVFKGTLIVKRYSKVSYQHLLLKL